MSKPTFLPYYCQTFKTEHLLEPCQKNLARVKALKVAKKHVGPLELCLECKGKALITVPLPNKSFEEGRMSTEEEAMVIHPAIPVPKPYRQDWEPVPEVTTAPVFLKDVGKKESEMKPFTPPYSSIVDAERKAGHNLGKKYKKREKILPELPIVVIGEHLQPAEAAEMAQVKPEVLAQRVLEGKVLQPGPNSPYPRDYGARYCPTHPEVLQRVDKLGRWMGMCTECLALRGKKCGLENFYRGVAAPPMSIPLNMPKYAEVKEWLAAQAEENERSLGQQVMMVLKVAWRQGT